MRMLACVWWNGCMAEQHWLMLIIEFTAVLLPPPLPSHLRRRRSMRVCVCSGSTLQTVQQTILSSSSSALCFVLHRRCITASCFWTGITQVIGYTVQWNWLGGFYEKPSGVVEFRGRGWRPTRPGQLVIYKTTNKMVLAEALKPDLFDQSA